MRYSADFEEWEFKVSSDHPKVADKMKLRPYQRQRLIFLCESILQPVRDDFGYIEILSGKRTKTLNKLTKGSAKDSDHLYCIAADIFPRDASLGSVYYFIKNHLPYRELILHKNSIHVSVNIPKRIWKKFNKEIQNV